MQVKSFMFDLIRSELEDAVGVENVSTSEVDRASYTVDYFWLSRMWQDRGAEGPQARHHRPSRLHRGSLQGSEDRQLL